MSSEAVRRALAVAARHPRVRGVGNVVSYEDRGVEEVEITFCVPLPNEWRVEGESPSTGVRAEEQVRFDFPRDFPLLAPSPSLRLDFNRNLPHIQPYMTGDGRPVPCIYDGELRELLHHQGWLGILNHTAIWLERASTSNLIDPDQGWEPVRRDCLRDCVVADASDVRRVVDSRGGSTFRRVRYVRLVSADGDEHVYSRVHPERLQISKDVVPSIFGERPTSADATTFWGKSLAVLVWPGKHPSGELILNDAYLPETVSNVKGLHECARQYGCLRELDNAFRILRKALSNWKPEGPFKLTVLLLARRPLPLIGSDSQIEICPYVVDIHSPGLFACGSRTAVYPAAHRHQISRDLLAQMAGDSSSAVLDWTLLGAGSLGSKVAVHLARAGRGPQIVVDRAVLSPHNAARHALLPAADDSEFLWTRDKATALCDTLRGLKGEVTPVTADVVSIIQSQSVRRHLGKRPWVVLNSTASLPVQEALASTDALSKSRVIEIGLFGGGSVGLLTVEGPRRNPNTVDLMAECYRLIGEDLVLREAIFGDGHTSRQQVGQGCGSLTMTMSDGRLSLFAAAMSEYVLGKQRDGLSDRSGEILIGRLLDDGLSLTWRAAVCEPVEIVTTENSGWRVRVGRAAKQKIEKEVRSHPSVETGGALIGRLSEVNKSVYVVDALEAPEDSIRARGQFVLGTKGLGRRISSYTNATGGALYCVGTWHNHATPSGPSEIDKATAKSLSLVEQSPFVLLIHTPDGFRGLLGDVY